MVVVWKDAEELNQKKFLECNGLALSVALGVRQFTSGGPVPGLHQCLGKWAVRSLFGGREEADGHSSSSVF